MKKFSLFLALGMASAMFVACGDSSSSSNSSSGSLVSCTVEESMGELAMKSCVETSDANVFEKFKAACTPEKQDMEKTTVGTGCASGSKKKCDKDSFSIYFYDEFSAAFVTDCSKINVDDYFEVE